jgi:hypothetical protein
VYVPTGWFNQDWHCPDRLKIRDRSVILAGLGKNYPAGDPAPTGMKEKKASMPL